MVIGDALQFDGVFEHQHAIAGRCDLLQERIGEPEIQSSRPDQDRKNA